MIDRDFALYPIVGVPSFPATDLNFILIKRKYFLKKDNQSRKLIIINADGQDSVIRQQFM